MFSPSSVHMSMRKAKLLRKCFFSPICPDPILFRLPLHGRCVRIPSPYSLRIDGRRAGTARPFPLWRLPSGPVSPPFDFALQRKRATRRKGRRPKKQARRKDTG